MRNPFEVDMSKDLQDIVSDCERIADDVWLSCKHQNIAYFRLSAPWSKDPLIDGYKDASRELGMVLKYSAQSRANMSVIELVDKLGKAGGNAIGGDNTSVTRVPAINMV